MHPRAFVTGSSRGIGRAIALELTRQGWEVIIHGATSSSELQETANALGDGCKGVVVADLADPASLPGLFRDVESLGAMTALVNNAGIYMPLDFLNADDRAFDENLKKTFAVNFESPIRLTRMFAQTFANQGGGKILNVASRVGFRGEAGAATYSASKSALINLTRALAVELAPKNIQIYGIAPGWVETAMARTGMEQRLPTILESIPLGRMASPEDCAASAAFLLSPQAAYLSGVVIDINGASYFH